MRLNIIANEKPSVMGKGLTIKQILSKESVATKNDQRKKQRLIQVREQSNQIASKIRKRVQEERERHKNEIELIKKKEVEKWKQHKIDELEHNLKNSEKKLNARDEAKCELQTDQLHAEQSEQLRRLCIGRGRHALRTMQDQKKAGNVKKRSKSTGIQTDSVDPHQISKVNRAVQSDEQEHKSMHDFEIESDPMNDSIMKMSLPPELPKGDDYGALNEKPVRDTDIQTNTIPNGSDEKDDEQEPVCEDRIIIPTKFKEKAPNKPIVRSNKTVQMRSKSLPRTPTAKKMLPIVAKPTRTLPSKVEETRSPKGKSNKVSFYDHANRFSKQYEMPKQVVTKITQLDGGNACEEALKETYSEHKEIELKENRLKVLKEKEMAREKDAQKKTELRHDYEMLAKELEEIRRTTSKGVTNDGSTNGQAIKSVQGNVILQRVRAEKQAAMNEAFEELLHQPVLITCPKVSSSKGGINVSTASDLSNDDAMLSQADSRNTLVLQDINKKGKGQVQVYGEPKTVYLPRTIKYVEAEAENEGQNVRIKTSEILRRGEPLKILIEVDTNNMVASKPEINDLQTVNKRGGASTVRLNAADISTSSTSYMSPPVKVSTVVENMSKFDQLPTRNMKKHSHKEKRQVMDPMDLKSYVDKLLSMDRTEVPNVSVSDISSSRYSLHNHSSIVDTSRLVKADKIIEDSYCLLNNVEETINKKKFNKTDNKDGYNRDKVHSSTSQQSKKKNHSHKRPQNHSKAPSADIMLEQYAKLASDYTKKMETLTDMINKVRVDKEKLLRENNTISERDTSTKYREFANTSKHGGSETSAGFSGSSLKSTSMEKNDKIEVVSLNKDAKSMLKKGCYKQIGQSRDSGISVSRPMIPTEVSPVVLDSSNSTNSDGHIKSVSDKSNIRSGHDLSTIVELDTQGTTVQGKEKKPESLSNSLKSDLDKLNAVTATQFAPFEDENDLDLTEIENQLKKRNLICHSDKAIQDRVDSLKEVSQDLDEIIANIRNKAVKSMSYDEFKKKHNLSGETIGLDAVPAADNTVTNLMNDIDVLRKRPRFEVDKELTVNSSNSNGGSVGCGDSRSSSSSDKIMGIPRSPLKIATHRRRDSQRSKGERSLSVNSNHSVSGDLLKLLETNLNQLGLKWASNMLHKNDIGGDLTTSSSQSMESISINNTEADHLSHLRQMILSKLKTKSNLSEMMSKSGDDLTRCTNNQREDICQQLLDSACNSSTARHIKTSTPVPSTPTLTGSIGESGNKQTGHPFSSELSSVYSHVSSCDQLRVPDMKLNLDDRP